MSWMRNYSCKLILHCVKFKDIRGLEIEYFHKKIGFCGKADEQIGYETSAYSSEEKSNNQRGINKRNKRPLLKADKFPKQFSFCSHLLEINKKVVIK